ncbi:MAG: hypothetical protein ABSE98_09955 [Acidimicrobiales bacterium]|jgi:3-hydroxyisobutyrate dehydrogenase-like beta-hydroxyacid dehydrogenase
MDDTDRLQAARTMRRAGFSSSLMAKDVRLYLSAVEEVSGPRSMDAVTASAWEDFDRSEPGADFTRIFPFVENS